MTEVEKRQIAEQLKKFSERVGGQNKAARMLDGVSTATVSKILTGKWETIGDEMWRGIAAKIGGTTDEWHIVTTEAFLRMQFIMQNAKDGSQVMGVTGFAGGGKSEAIKHFATTTKNVYHLMCSEYWNRPTFIQQLMKAMGLRYGGTQADQMEEIIEELKCADHPLIILDEADKLRDQVLYFFITLYNELEGSCGIILCATDYLRKRIERGLRISKKGYEEIYSRLGRKFIQLQVINDEDIRRVCIGNGVTDPDVIEAITKEADSDLRRVKRAIWATRRTQSCELKVKS